MFNPNLWKNKSYYKDSEHKNTFNSYYTKIKVQIVRLVFFVSPGKTSLFERFVHVFYAVHYCAVSTFLSNAFNMNMHETNATSKL